MGSISVDNVRQYAAIGSKRAPDIGNGRVAPDTMMSRSVCGSREPREALARRAGPEPFAWCGWSLLHPVNGFSGTRGSTTLLLTASTQRSVQL